MRIIYIHKFWIVNSFFPLKYKFCVISNFFALKVCEIPKTKSLISDFLKNEKAEKVGNGDLRLSPIATILNFWVTVNFNNFLQKWFLKYI